MTISFKKQYHHKNLDLYMYNNSILYDVYPTDNKTEYSFTIDLAKTINWDKLK
jgi:hypothetical protein